MATEYYEGKELFITGGSGVVGKGIIEKLLRSTDVKSIFMLLRTKRNKTIDDRLTQIKKSLIFDRLKKERPNALDKLFAIEGDICLPLLGLSAESLQLIENVDIVIHSAATIRFDEPLRVAIKINVGGTHECIKVGQKMNDLKLFVHVSTYFSNPCESFVKSTLHTPPVDWKMALKIAESDIPDEKLETFCRKYTTNFPNTYTFTKNLSETVVADHYELFPIMVTRPSVILSTRYEPYPGFMEKMQGVTGTVAFFGTGLMHSMYANPKTNLDLIWTDLVVNLHLLSIARVGLMKKKLIKPEVVLICTYPHCQSDLEERYGSIVQYQRQFPFSKCFGHYNIKMVSCYYHFVLRVLAYQVVPSLLVDLLLRASNMKPLAMVGQRKMFVGCKEQSFFCKTSFRSDGVTHLADLVLLSKESVFSIDSLFQQTNDVSIGKSFDAYLSGTRKYLLRDDESTLPAARRRYKIIEAVTFFKDAIIYMVLAWLLFRYF